MYYITVEKTFDAAHYLQGYKGKCEKLHGHSYRVAATLSARKLDDTGLAYDFTELKKQLGGILEKYDHNALNEVPHFNKINPSAENIARVIFDNLAPAVKGEANLVSVEVWESPTSHVLYKP